MKKMLIFSSVIRPVTKILAYNIPIVILLPMATQNIGQIILKRELGRRIERNPQYSLRAFAKALGLTHSMTSMIISGKRNITRKTCEKILDTIDLPHEEMILLKSFCKNKNSSLLQTESEQSTQMDLDNFAVISDWYHLAMLSFLELPNAEWDARIIAKHLKMTLIQAQMAMQRLENLGMVEKLENGKWKQTSAPLRFNNKNSTQATRKYHAGLLDRAKESLELDNPEERNFSSIMLPMDPKLMQVAALKIREFRLSLMKELEAEGGYKKVFALNVQLFPLTS